MNEFYEFARILLYLVGTLGILYLAIIHEAARPVLLGIGSWFMMWASLLVIQINNPNEYRAISNALSTPALFVIVLVIFYNLMRK